MNFVRIIIGLLFISFASNWCLGQGSQFGGDKSNLYLLSLEAYLNKRNEMYEGNEYLKKQDYLNIVVEQDIHLTDRLPTSIGRNSIQYLDYAGRIEMYKKLRKEFRLIVLRPMKNEGDVLVISFGEYLWSYQKKNNSSMYSLSDGARVEIRFDCDSRKFIVSKVELWGV